MTSDRSVFQDATRDPDARALHLLGQMSLPEKVGQLAMVTIHRSVDTSRTGSGSYFTDGSLEELLAGPSPVGGLLSGAGGAPSPNTARDWARMTNEAQRVARARSRFAIPLLYGVDAIHGHNNVLGTTIFPHAIGIGASWDPELAREVAERVSQMLRATGVHWNFSPNADIATDPRWGRFYETFGEDPLLVSRMVAASVRGYQGGIGVAPAGVAATAKHLVAYGATANGLDRTNVDVSHRALWETHLPSFEAAIAAGAASVMMSSGSVNGVPAHASAYLMRDLLRRDLGFDGVVISDWGDVWFLDRHYRMVADYAAAVELSINAGVDVCMIGFREETFRETLLSLVESGRVAESRIDEAVRRILRLKFALHLFENPFTDEGGVTVLEHASNRDLAARAARESLVLLVNDGVLPLSPGMRVFLCGPAADRADWQHGGYTIGWQRVPQAKLPGVPGETIRTAFEAAQSAGACTTVAGAEDADVVVVCVGEPASAEFGGDDRRARLDLEQQDLLTAMAATGKPVVAVLVAGRPLDLGSAWESPAALVMAHRPGSAGGEAVTDLLLGKAEPTGRLPYTWHRHAGQLPMTHAVLPSACDDQGSEELRGPVYDAAFPFGSGLSYTTFTVDSFEVRPVDAGGLLPMTITVSNTGDRDGTTMVPIWATARSLGVLFPRRVLLDWVRVSVAAGGSRAWTGRVALDRLARCPGDVATTARAVVHPGRYEISAGSFTHMVEVGASPAGHGG